MKTIKRYLFLIIMMLPIIVNASSYKQVNSIEELSNGSEILIVSDNKVFEFTDMLENPTIKEVVIKDNVINIEDDINNRFITNGSISDKTLKSKPLVTGDISKSCIKNTSCKKGILYLKDTMFHYQDKEIKIEELSIGNFTVRSDNTHYLNFDNGTWKVSSNPQNLNIYRKVDELKYNYFTDENIIIGEFSKDYSDEVNESYVDIVLHYGIDEESGYRYYYKYKNNNTVDLVFKLVDLLDNDKYEQYLLSDEYLDSNYVVTMVYATQSSKYSNISNNGVSTLGGRLDNVVGESMVHIYLSLKYSSEYYLSNDKLNDLSVKDRYIIDPNYYDVPDGYEEVIDSTILNSINYVEHDDNKFIYNIDLENYETEIFLPENEYKLPWYLNGKKVTNVVDVATNIDKLNNNTFMFKAFKEVENPNTLDLTITYIVLSFIIIGLLVALRKVIRSNR